MTTLPGNRNRNSQLAKLWRLYFGMSIDYNHRTVLKRNVWRMKNGPIEEKVLFHQDNVKYYKSI